MTSMAYTPDLKAHDDCVFCRIAAGKIPCHKLYEDQRTVAFLDINPVNPGHALVISKTHAPTLFEMSDDDLAAVMAVVKRVARAVHRVCGPDGINLHQANGAGSAQSVFHYHMHVVPRRFRDNLIMNWELKAGDPADIAAVAEKLRSAVEAETQDLRLPMPA
jgi:histidine triad (HIT) family protein